MIDFDVDLSTQTKASVKPIDPDDTVTISRNARSWLGLNNTASWDWSQLRDYVIYEIESREGPQQRNLAKESAIFKGFMKRQPRAIDIAHYAFGHCGGMWKKEPITVNRFCKAADPWFADLIVKRLIDRPDPSVLPDIPEESSVRARGPESSRQPARLSDAD